MKDHPFKLRRMAAMGIDVIETHYLRSFCRHTHNEFGIGLIVDGVQPIGQGGVVQGCGNVAGGDALIS